MQRMVVIDFETTGMSPDRGDRAIELAGVMIEGDRILDRFQSLMSSGVRIPCFIQELTGITDEMLVDAPDPSEVMADFAAFAGNCPIVAHNASFDTRFLDAEWSRIGIQRRQPAICSMLLSRRVYPEAPNHKLGTLSSYLELPSCGDFHRALADAETTAHLMFRMALDLRRKFGQVELGAGTLEGLQKTSKGAIEMFMRSRLL